MRKAKIVCTIGPASSSENIINKMIESGMDVARLNFSHGTHDDHKNTVSLIRNASIKKGIPVTILQDLKGLKIRTGLIENNAVRIKSGSTIRLTSRNVLGNSSQIQISYSTLMKDLEPGSRVLIDDGLIQLKIVKKEGNGLLARVIEGGIVSNNKGVNFPDIRVSAKTFTRKDRDDLRFGIKVGVDYIALSFVRSKEDILRIKKWLKKNNADIPVIAKIENRQALENIDGIINISDGIMVARGDLGVEISPEEVPIIQKELIQKCNAALKPVITATQMLDSMTEHTRPTRAEAADVANAVIDGTDALMLSGETAIGKYPLQALNMMGRIIRHTEEHSIKTVDAGVAAANFAEAIAEASCLSAIDINAKTVVAFTKSGFTACLVSKFRPMQPITGFTENETVCRRMNLYWGTTPYILKFPGNTDQMILESEKLLLTKKIVRKGDPIVIIAASPFAQGGNSNIMKLHKVGS